MLGAYTRELVKESLKFKNPPKIYTFLMIFMHIMIGLAFIILLLNAHNSSSTVTDIILLKLDTDEPL